MSFLSKDKTRLVGPLFGDDGRRKSGVLLLHRSTSDMASWFPFAERLMDEGYAVLAFDFRGYGQSEGERDPAAYPDDVEGALEILYLFGVDRAAVVGTEVGGTAAIAGAARSPDLVRGVVAIESTPAFEGLDVRQVAPTVRADALVIAGSAGRDELADLLPSARFAQMAIAGEPERDEQVNEAILAFVRGSVGRP